MCNSQGGSISATIFRPGLEQNPYLVVVSLLSLFGLRQPLKQHTALKPAIIFGKTKIEFGAENSPCQRNDTNPETTHCIYPHNMWRAIHLPTGESRIIHIRIERDPPVQWLPPTQIYTDTKSTIQAKTHAMITFWHSLCPQLHEKLFRKTKKKSIITKGEKLVT